MSLVQTEMRDNSGGDNRVTWGGCISMRDGESLSITSSKFTNNYASGGGAVSVISTNTTITNSVFDENMASWGGAIRIVDSDVSISASNFTSNTAGWSGGALYTV